MTAMTAEPSIWELVNRGRAALIRFYAYIGASLGISAMAMYAEGGYNEDAFLYQILSSQGLLWGGTGALIAAAVAVILVTMKPAMLQGRVAPNTVPWLDGMVLMVILAVIAALFEPAADQVFYEDQSNLLAANIIMTMNIVFIFSAVAYIALPVCPGMVYRT